MTDFWTGNRLTNPFWSWRKTPAQRAEYHIWELHNMLRVMYDAERFGMSGTLWNAAVEIQRDALAEQVRLGDLANTDADIIRGLFRLLDFWPIQEAWGPTRPSPNLIRALLGLAPLPEPWLEPRPWDPRLQATR